MPKTTKQKDIKSAKPQLAKLAQCAEKYAALMIMAACTYLYIESQVDAKPVIQTGVAVAAVILLVRSQFRK